MEPGGARLVERTGQRRRALALSASMPAVSIDDRVA
jgi:hypothetical protein